MLAYGSFVYMDTLPSVPVIVTFSMHVGAMYFTSNQVLFCVQEGQSEERYKIAVHSAESVCEFG